MSNGAINLWITPDGQELLIPDDIFKATTFRKDGWPDKRVKANAVFWKWLEERTAPKAKLANFAADAKGGTPVDPDKPIQFYRDPMAKIEADESARVAANMAAAAWHADAQAYAMRIWNGQSPDVKREEKIRRVKLALEGQNLPFEGVELP